MKTTKKILTLLLWTTALWVPSAYAATTAISSIPTTNAVNAQDLIVWDSTNGGGGYLTKVITATNLEQAIAAAFQTGSGLLGNVSGQASALQFGVKNDGVTDTTTEIINAIAQTNVFFPSGVYVVNAQIPIPSNRRITLAPGATFFASSNRNFVNSATPNNATFFVNADIGSSSIVDSNIIVEGGVYDGNSANQSWTATPTNVTWVGGVGMRFGGVSNLIVRDIILSNIPSFNMQLGHATNVLLNNVTIQETAAFGPGNQDGIHINGFTRNVRINHLWRNMGGDDFVALNADDGSYGQGSGNGPINDVVVTDLYTDHANVTLYAGSAIRILNSVDVISNVTFKGVRGVYGNDVIDMGAYLGTPTAPVYGIKFEDFNVTSSGTASPFLLQGLPVADTLALRDIHWHQGATDGGFVNWDESAALTNFSARDIEIDDWAVTGTEVPAFLFSYGLISNVMISDCFVLRNPGAANNSLFLNVVVSATMLATVNMDNIVMRGDPAPLFYGNDATTNTGKVILTAIDTGAGYDYQSRIPHLVGLDQTFSNLTATGPTKLAGDLWCEGGGYILPLQGGGNCQIGGAGNEFLAVDAYLLTGRWLNLSGLSGTPGISPGNGDGAGGTASVVGNDSRGTITLTTGTGPAVNDIIATITFTAAKYNADAVVMLTPVGDTNAPAPILIGGLGTSGFRLYSGHTVGLAAGTTYKLQYLCVE